MYKCKTTSGCYGFIYDNNTCDLSYKPIIDKQYNRCNKLSTAHEQPKIFEDMRGNASFLCADKNDDKINYYIHNDIPEIKTSMIDIYNSTNIKDYILRNEIYEKQDIDKYFVEQKNKFTGKKKCNIDNPLKTCMSLCHDNNDCIGIYWLDKNIIYDNTKKDIITYNNICCQFSEITNSKNNKNKIEKYYIKIIK